MGIIDWHNLAQVRNSPREYMSWEIGWIEVGTGKYPAFEQGLCPVQLSNP